MSKSPVVAIQGQAGSFHHQAAMQWYGTRVKILPCATFSEAFDAHVKGTADTVVTAVENTLYGSINEVYRLVEECESPIIGEVKLSVDQMLIAQPGAKLSDITEVYSHPVALAQCREFLKKQLSNATLVEFFDTAGAVEFVARESKRHIAAVAGKLAADLYGLPILVPSIQDSQDNITRFLILEPSDPPADATRASLVITTDHQPGALIKVLNIFAQSGVNLAKLQSQPIVGQPWRYKFFMVVDCSGPKLYQLLKQIEIIGHTVTILGEYRAG